MKKTNLFPFSAAALVAVALAGCNYFSGDDEISSTYGTDKVENEQFIVSFSEGGELVSVNAVKVENEMDGSASIVSIVDEGSYVKGPRQIQAEAGDTPAKLAARHKIPESDLLKANPNLEQAIANQESITVPGDLLVELDPGSLKDRILSQEISVRTSKNSLIKSQNDLEIQKLRNEQNIDDAKISLNFADLDLKKFKNSDARLTREDYAGQLSNLSNKVSISEAKLVYLRELEKKQFLSKMSLREEEQKVAEFRHNIRMMRGESDAYEKYVYPKSEQDYNSKIKQAELSLTTVEQTATNNMITATEEVDTQKQKLRLEEEKLTEVKDQLNKSRIYAPSSGLVVYHVGESSRYGGSSGIIEKGTTLRKGQDIIHLPDLSKMKVKLKVHESRINQVKGPEEVKTKRSDTVASLAVKYSVSVKALREKNEGEYVKGEYKEDKEKYPKLEETIAKEGMITIPGLPVQIRINTIADRIFRGEITYVAPVAAAAERYGSGKKVFKCEISVLDKLPPYIRPGASVICRIYVAKLEKVRMVDGKKVKTLRVPIQSVISYNDGRQVCFRLNGEKKPEPVEVETGYYDQTHIQITSGLALGEIILKAPLLHAKLLDVDAGLFGFRQIDDEEFIKDLPATIEPATPAPSSAQPTSPKGGHESPASPTVAQKGKGSPGGSGRPSLMSYDKDGDGKVSKDEVPEEMKRYFDRMDSDGDGFITQSEVDALRQSAGGGVRPAGGGSNREDFMKRFDKDGDGQLSEEERAAMRSSFGGGKGKGGGRSGGGN